jgi:NADH:ubiquinone oxidoreductase subunit F (NADH-binding)/(2Fe-2S) ferredoxin
MNDIKKTFEDIIHNKCNNSENKITKHFIQVGAATCEKAAGSDDVRKTIERLLAAANRNDIEIKQTGCTGCCSQEPIVTIFSEGSYPTKYSKVNVNNIHEIFVSHFNEKKIATNHLLDNRITEFSDKTIFVSTNGNVAEKITKKVLENIKNKIEVAVPNNDKIVVVQGGRLTLGSSKEKPNVFFLFIFPDNIFYQYETEVELNEIIDTHFNQGQIAGDYIIEISVSTQNQFRLYGDIGFLQNQTRIALRNCGIIDPDKLEDYLSVQGFEALCKALISNNPDKIIDDIIKSGLRGRGGGGFPTGQKWKMTRASEGDIKYIVCNADEGDPGAFMDRSVLEGDPFDILEGMLIAGFAIGAAKGFIYIRAEYPLAIKRIENAIEQCEKNNLLGKNILNSGFNFEIEIRLGAGAFVCGEETALLESIEGKRGQPHIRPPYPAVKGLWGKPTCINNVETWANVPAILLNGPDWFNKLGTEGSKGTKVFALAGKVRNTGLIEVPMGTTLREVVFDIGGGIPNGHTFKAVQTGGPSGGSIPISEIDTPIDYDRLKSIGSMMGSGGMIVLDDTDCMVSTSKFFLEFTKDESCGKCTSCREGTLRMLEILVRITNGQGKEDDISKLIRLGNDIQKTALCGLGQTAPNPVISAIKHFREEFDIHINEKRCPTLKCKNLITFTIDSEKCTGCTMCVRRCPLSAISGITKKPHTIHQQHCIKCGDCFVVCKFGAIERR